MGGGTGEVTGHAMAEHMRAELVCDAIDLFVGRGLTSGDAIVHSDRESQPSTPCRLSVPPSLCTPHRMPSRAIEAVIFSTGLRCDHLALVTHFGGSPR